MFIDQRSWIGRLLPPQYQAGCEPFGLNVVLPGDWNDKHSADRPVIGVVGNSIFHLSLCLEKEAATMEESGQIVRSIWYLHKETYNVATGKDIRLYGMRTWMAEFYRSLIRRLEKIEGKVRALTSFMTWQVYLFRRSGIWRLTAG